MFKECEMTQILFLGLKYDFTNQNEPKWDFTCQKVRLKKKVVTLHEAQEYSSTGKQMTIVFTTASSSQA